MWPFTKKVNPLVSQQEHLLSVEKRLSIINQNINADILMVQRDFIEINETETVPCDHDYYTAYHESLASLQASQARIDAGRLSIWERLEAIQLKL